MKLLNQPHLKLTHFHRQIFQQNFQVFFFSSVSQNSSDVQIHVSECQGCWWKYRMMVILFVSGVHQKYLKQVTFHNELKQAFLSVMSYQQRMMADHHTTANDLTHIKIVFNSFGLLAPNHIKLYLTAVSSEA